MIELPVLALIILVGVTFWCGHALGRDKSIERQISLLKDLSQAINEEEKKND